MSFSLVAHRTQYGTRTMLVKKGVIPSPTATSDGSDPPSKVLDSKAGPIRGPTKSSNGGKELKPNPNPLTVIHDPEEDDTSQNNLQDIFTNLNISTEDDSTSSDKAA